MVAALVAAWLLLAAATCTQQREQDFYDFKAVNIRGKLVSLEKYRGSVSVRPGGRAAPAPLRRGLMGAPGCPACPAGCGSEGPGAASRHGPGSQPPPC